MNPPPPWLPPPNKKNYSQKSKSPALLGLTKRRVWNWKFENFVIASFQITVNNIHYDT